MPVIFLAGSFIRCMIILQRIEQILDGINRIKTRRIQNINKNVMNDKRNKIFL